MTNGYCHHCDHTLDGIAYNYNQPQTQILLFHVTIIKLSRSAAADRFCTCTTNGKNDIIKNSKTTRNDRKTDKSTICCKCKSVESAQQKTCRKLTRCLRRPIRTSSKSRSNSSKTGTRSERVNSSPSITARWWIENASVRRTFHWQQNQDRSAPTLVSATDFMHKHATHINSYLSQKMLSVFSATACDDAHTGSDPNVSRENMH